MDTNGRKVDGKWTEWTENGRKLHGGLERLDGGWTEKGHKWTEVGRSLNGEWTELGPGWDGAGTEWTEIGRNGRRVDRRWTEIAQSGRRLDGMDGA